MVDIPHHLLSRHPFAGVGDREFEHVFKGVRYPVDIPNNLASLAFRAKNGFDSDWLLIREGIVKGGSHSPKRSSKNPVFSTDIGRVALPVGIRVDIRSPSEAVGLRPLRKIEVAAGNGR